MGIVELDDVGKAAWRCAGEFGKVSVEIDLEFMEEHGQFRFKIRHLFCRGNICGVDDFRSKLSQLFDSANRDCVSFGAVAEIDLPGDADARSAQGSGIGYGAGEWTDCVLVVGDRNDASAAGEADGRLDTDDPIR